MNSKEQEMQRLVIDSDAQQVDWSIAKQHLRDEIERLSSASAAREESFNPPNLLTHWCGPPAPPRSWTDTNELPFLLLIYNIKKRY